MYIFWYQNQKQPIMKNQTIVYEKQNVWFIMMLWLSWDCSITAHTCWTCCHKWVISTALNFCTYTQFSFFLCLCDITHFDLSQSGRCTNCRTWLDHPSSLKKKTLASPMGNIEQTHSCEGSIQEPSLLSKWPKRSLLCSFILALVDNFATTDFYILLPSVGKTK